MPTHTSSILDTDVYGEASYIMKAEQDLSETQPVDIEKKTGSILFRKKWPDSRKTRIRT